MGKRLIGSVGLADSGVPDDLLNTKGDTHGFSSTNARIPIGDDDTVLTADSSEALGLKWATTAGGQTFARIVRNADTTITSDTTLSDDAQISIALNASKQYYFRCTLFINSHSTPDFKWAFSIPTGASGMLFRGTNEGYAGATASLTGALNTGTDGNNQALTFYGTVLSDSAGNFVLQWAQNNSSGEDTTLLKGSTLIMWEQT